MSAYDDASARLSQAPATPYYNLAANSVTNPGGLGGYGHRTAFFALIADILTVASYMLAQATTFLTNVTAQAAAAATSATNAAASSASALNAPGTMATTTANIIPAAGVIAFPLQQLNKAFSEGQTVVVASAAAPSTKYIQGRIVLFTPGTGAMQVDVQAGYFAGGAFADGKVSLAAGGGVAASRNVATAGLAIGGGDLSADRTINVPAAVAADLKLATSTTTSVTPKSLADAIAWTALTYASVIAWAANTIGPNGRVILTANATVGAPTGLIDGEVYAICPIQDATGGRTLAWDAIWDWGVNSPIVLPTAANKRAIVVAIYENSKLRILSTWKEA